jgi:AmmeMemoRadiSam system protein B/AmmeMemoRadiSam system protein A
MKELCLPLFLALLPAAALQAREPAVAGQFYPADKAALAAFVDGALAAPGAAKRGGELVAVLVPHAGYAYSGKMAGQAYKYIGDSYDTVVILATGHTEGVKGAALLVSDLYETPLGQVRPDKDLAAALMKASPLFEDRPSAHAREHAVEVQLPFLQRKLKRSFLLLPAVLNTRDLPALKKIGAALAAALRGKKALIVISTDFSHYPSRETAAAADGAMLLAMGGMDPALVWQTARILDEKKVPGLDTCACGEAALEAGMEAARLMGAASFLPVKLSDSNAENPGQAGAERVVGYISGLFVKGGKAAVPALLPEEKQALLKEARRTLENYFAGKENATELAADPRLDLPGAAFVTLTARGKLRGCVGTLEPSMTLLDAVRYGAVSAAFRDGRFQPLKAEELPGVRIEISVLTRPTPAKAAEIRPGLHGVVAAKGGRTGLFLPQVWAQLPVKENFLGELCAQKAGLPRDCWKDEQTALYTFTADAFSEKQE